MTLILDRTIYLCYFTYTCQVGIWEENGIMADLRKEFEYYQKEQDKLVKQFDGKFIVIKDEQVIGSYDNELEAIQETSKEFELGTFLVQKCEPGKNSYYQTYHSRVAIV